MRQIIYSLMCAIAFCVPFNSAARSKGNGKFAVKANANIGLGKAFGIKSSLPGMSPSSSANDFGVDFGWTFFSRKQNSLELNVGVSYEASDIKAELESCHYSYDASAGADMDGETYVRYYELSGIHQKMDMGRLTVPVYLSYVYRCNSRLRLHADLGVRLGFKVSSKVSEVSGEGYSYGIYPQYDDLMIDAGYINDFGTKSYTKEAAALPEANAFSCSVLAGVGAEFRIYGPLAADLSLRYLGGLTDQYKPGFSGTVRFDENDSPVTYTVAGGERMKALSDYFTSSRLSQLRLCLSLIYRF